MGVNYHGGSLLFFSPFIRLRRNTLQLAAGLKGKVNRAEAHQSEGGLLLLYHFNVEMATAQFRFDTPTACGGGLHFMLHSQKFQT
jgi:hypothetical protein